MARLWDKLTGREAVETQMEQITRIEGRRVARRYRQTSLRTLKAAASDRLQASWNPTGQNSDSITRMGLRKARNRSRELYYNNELAKHFCRLLKNNVVGSNGIRFKAKAKDPDGTLDSTANNKIMSGFKKWGKRGTCDVTGKLSWIDIQKLALETCARDGEVLVRKVLGFPNAYGFALQMIEADHLDETLNAMLPNGNIIRMGVEVDKWDRPVAYHLLRRHPGDFLFMQARGSSHERIPAEEFIHLYLPEFIRQTRALPWLHAGMSRLKKMGTYDESELVASLVGSSKMGFYEPDPDADPSAFEGDDDEDTEDEFIEEVEAGTFGIVPYGYRIKEFDPQHPVGNYDPFMKRNTRTFSSGVGLNYVSLGNDLSEVNFSSVRFGTEEDRDFYQSLQTWLVEWLCDDVATSWLPPAMLSGKVNLPFAKLEKFLAFSWGPRRWGYVNPLQDVTAKEKQVNNNFDLRGRIVMETTGMDYEEYLKARQEEQRLEEKYQVDQPGKKPALPAS